MSVAADALPSSQNVKRWRIRVDQFLPLALLTESRICTYGLLSCSRRGLIGVNDLAAGGKPHALAFLHVGDGALEIFDAQRLAGDHRMQGHAQHPRLLAAVGVERVELIDNREQILL